MSRSKTVVELAEEQQLKERLIQLHAALAVKEQEVEIKRCIADPWYWLQQFVYTLDEIDPTLPIKKYPDWPMLHDRVRVWNAYPKIRQIAEEKSRRVLATLTWDALFLWDALFIDGRKNIITSQNEEKANIQIENRIAVMYDNLPQWMKDAYPAKATFGKFTVYGGSGTRKRIGSLIWSVPQENEQVRGETASNFLFDEVGFQTQGERNYNAAKPAVEMGKEIGPRIIMVSTATTGFWDRLIHDNL